jgi:hypothetical protein
MSVATEKINEIQDQVLDLVSRVQEPVVGAVRTASVKLEDRIPEVNVPWVGDTLPTATQLVDARFRFRQRMLDNQKEFVKAVMAATLPVRRKFVTTGGSPKASATAAVRNAQSKASAAKSSAKSSARKVSAA